MPTVSLPRFDLTSLELPTFDLSKLDLSKVALPKVDLPTFDLPKVELPKIDLSKVELPDVDVDRVLAVARDAAYAGIGLAVLGAQRAQEAARELGEVVQRTTRTLRRAA